MLNTFKCLNRIIISKSHFLFAYSNVMFALEFGSAVVFVADYGVF